VVVLVLGKYVYPSLIKALDAKKDELESPTRLERSQLSALDKASAKADDVVSDARSAPTRFWLRPRPTPRRRLSCPHQGGGAGERLVAEAREQIERDVLAARKELKAETAKLVAGHRRGTQ
jgi:F0F1-type ATP synthase membrane subunit b/b'